MLKDVHVGMALPKMGLVLLYAIIPCLVMYNTVLVNLRACAGGLL